MMPEAMQWGAMGLLALVLAGAGRAAWALAQRLLDRLGGALDSLVIEVRAAREATTAVCAELQAGRALERMRHEDLLRELASLRELRADGPGGGE